MAKISSEEVMGPTPATSQLYAISLDKAERASSDLSSPPISNSQTLTASDTTFQQEKPSIRSRLRGFMMPMLEMASGTFRRYLPNPPMSAITRFRSYCQERRRKKEDIQSLYEDFKRQSIGDKPMGWPQLAAFLHSQDNFAIFRRFGMAHCRVLVQLQAEIELLQQKLASADESDAIPGSVNTWRLHTALYEDGWDSTQRDLLKELQDKLIAYDTLLFNDQRLRASSSPSKADHLSVFHWILRKKPLGAGQYDWIYHPDDFVQQSQIPRFESSIVSSSLKKLFRTSNTEGQDPVVNHYSKSGISGLTKLFIVTGTVAILIIPIFILLWVPLTRAWISATVLISVLTFSTYMSIFTKAELREVLVGTAAYCAVLATFLGNTQGSAGAQSRT